MGGGTVARRPEEEQRPEEAVQAAERLLTEMAAIPSRTTGREALQQALERYDQARAELRQAADQVSEALRRHEGRGEAEVTAALGRLDSEINDLAAVRIGDSQIDQAHQQYITNLRNLVQRIRRGEERQAAAAIRRIQAMLERMDRVVDLQRDMMARGAPIGLVRSMDLAMTLPAERARVFLRAGQEFQSRIGVFSTEQGRDELQRLNRFMQGVASSRTFDAERAGTELTALMRDVDAEGIRLRTLRGQAFEYHIHGLQQMLTGTLSDPMRERIVQVIRDSRAMAERLRGEEANQVTEEQLGTLARRILTVRAATEAIADESVPRAVRAQMEQLFSSSLGALEQGNLQGAEIFQFAAQQVRSHPSARGAEGREHTAYRSRIIEAAGSVASAETATARRTAETDLVNIMAQRVRSEMVDAMEGLPESTRGILGRFESPLDSPTFENLQAASRALHATGRITAHLRAARISSERRATTFTMFDRGLEALRGGDVQTAAAQFELARGFSSRASTDAQREEFQSLSGALAEHPERLESVQAYIQLNNRILQLRGEAPRLGGPQAPARQAMDRLASELERYRALLATTGSVASEEEVTSRVAAIRARMGSEPEFRSRIESAARSARREGEAEDAAVARLINQEARREAEETARTRITVLMATGQSMVQRIRSVRGEGAGAVRTELGRIYGYSVEAAISGDVRDANAFRGAAETYASLRSARDRADVARICREANEAERSPGSRAITTRQQRELSVYSAVAERLQAITVPALRVNARAYLDLALLTARTGSADEFQYVMDMASSYAGLAAIDTRRLSSELRQRRDSTMAAITQTLGDYSRIGSRRLIDIGATGRRRWEPRRGTITSPIAAAVLDGSGIAETLGEASRETVIANLTERLSRTPNEEEIAAAVLEAGRTSFRELSGTSEEHSRLLDSLEFEERCGAALGSADAQRTRDRGFARERGRLTRLAERARGQGDEELAAFYGGEASRVDRSVVTDSVADARRMRARGEELRGQALTYAREAQQAATMSADEARLRLEQLAGTLEGSEQRELNQLIRRAGDDEEQLRQLLSGALTLLARRSAGEADGLIGDANTMLQGVDSYDRSVRRVSTRQRESGRRQIWIGLQTLRAIFNNQDISLSGELLTREEGGEQVPVRPDAERIRLLRIHGRSSVTVGTAAVRQQEAIQRMRAHVMHSARKDVRDRNRDTLHSSIDRMLETARMYKALPAERIAEFRARLARAMQIRSGSTGGQSTSHEDQAQRLQALYTEIANAMSIVTTDENGESLYDGNAEYRRYRLAVGQAYAERFGAARSTIADGSFSILTRGIRAGNRITDRGHVLHREMARGGRTGGQGGPGRGDFISSIDGVHFSRRVSELSGQETPDVQDLLRRGTIEATPTLISEVIRYLPKAERGRYEARFRRIPEGVDGEAARYRLLRELSSRTIGGVPGGRNLLDAVISGHSIFYDADSFDRRIADAQAVYASGQTAAARETLSYLRHEMDVASGLERRDISRVGHRYAIWRLEGQRGEAGRRLLEEYQGPRGEEETDRPRGERIDRNLTIAGNISDMEASLERSIGHLRQAAEAEERAIDDLQESGALMTPDTDMVLRMVGALPEDQQRGYDSLIEGLTSDDPQERARASLQIYERLRGNHRQMAVAVAAVRDDPAYRGFRHQLDADHMSARGSELSMQEGRARQMAETLVRLGQRELQRADFAERIRYLVNSQQYYRTRELLGGWSPHYRTPESHRGNALSALEFARAILQEENAGQAYDLLVRNGSISADGMHVRLRTPREWHDDQPFELGHEGRARQSYRFNVADQLAGLMLASRMETLSYADEDAHATARPIFRRIAEMEIDDTFLRLGVLRTRHDDGTFGLSRWQPSSEEEINAYNESSTQLARLLGTMDNNFVYTDSDSLLLGSWVGEPQAALATRIGQRAERAHEAVMRAARGELGSSRRALAASVPISAGGHDRDQQTRAALDWTGSRMSYWRTARIGIDVAAIAVTALVAPEFLPAAFMITSAPHAAEGYEMRVQAGEWTGEAMFAFGMGTAGMVLVPLSEFAQAVRAATIIRALGRGGQYAARAERLIVAEQAVEAGFRGSRFAEFMGASGARQGQLLARAETLSASLARGEVSMAEAAQFFGRGSRAMEFLAGQPGMTGFQRAIHFAGLGMMGVGTAQFLYHFPQTLQAWRSGQITFLEIFAQSYMAFQPAVQGIYMTRAAAPTRAGLNPHVPRWQQALMALALGVPMQPRYMHVQAHEASALRSRLRELPRAERTEYHNFMDRHGIALEPGEQLGVLREYRAARSEGRVADFEQFAAGSPRLRMEANEGIYQRIRSGDVDPMQLTESQMAYALARRNGAEPEAAMRAVEQHFLDTSSPAARRLEDTFLSVLRGEREASSLSAAEDVYVSERMRMRGPAEARRASERVTAAEEGAVTLRRLDRAAESRRIEQERTVLDAELGSRFSGRSVTSAEGGEIFTLGRGEQEIRFAGEHVDAARELIFHAQRALSRPEGQPLARAVADARSRIRARLMREGMGRAEADRIAGERANHIEQLARDPEFIRATGAADRAAQLTQGLESAGYLPEITRRQEVIDATVRLETRRLLDRAGLEPADLDQLAIGRRQLAEAWSESGTEHGGRMSRALERSAEALHSEATSRRASAPEARQSTPERTATPERPEMPRRPERYQVEPPEHGLVLDREARVFRHEDIPGRTFTPDEASVAKRVLIFSEMIRLGRPIPEGANAAEVAIARRLHSDAEFAGGDRRLQMRRAIEEVTRPAEARPSPRLLEDARAARLRERFEPDAVAARIWQRGGRGERLPEYLIGGEAVRTGDAAETLSTRRMLRTIDDYVLALARHGQEVDIITFSGDKRRLNQINDAIGMGNGDRALSAYREVLRRAAAYAAGDDRSFIIRPALTGDEVLGVLVVRRGRGAEVRRRLVEAVRRAEGEVFRERMDPDHPETLAHVRDMVRSPRDLVNATVETGDVIQVRRQPDGELTATRVREDGTTSDAIIRRTPPEGARPTADQVQDVQHALARQARGDTLTAREQRIVSEYERIARTGVDRETAVREVAGQTEEITGPGLSNADDPSWAPDMRRRLGIEESMDFTRHLERVEAEQIVRGIYEGRARADLTAQERGWIRDVDGSLARQMMPEVTRAFETQARGEVLSVIQRRIIRDVEARIAGGESRESAVRAAAIAEGIRQGAPLEVALRSVARPLASSERVAQLTNILPGDTLRSGIAFEARLEIPNEAALRSVRTRLPEAGKGIAELLRNSFGIRGLNTYLGHTGANGVMTVVERAVADFARSPAVRRRGLRVRRLGTLKYHIEGGTPADMRLLRGMINRELANAGIDLRMSRRARPHRVRDMSSEAALAEIMNGHLIVDRRQDPARRSDWDGEELLYETANQVISTIALGDDVALVRLLGTDGYRAMESSGIIDLVRGSRTAGYQQYEGVIRNFEDLILVIRDEAGRGNGRARGMEGLFRRLVIENEPLYRSRLRATDIMLTAPTELARIPAEARRAREAYSRREEGLGIEDQAIVNRMDLLMRTRGLSEEQAAARVADERMRPHGVRPDANRLEGEASFTGMPHELYDRRVVQGDGTTVRLGEAPRARLLSRIDDSFEMSGASAGVFRGEIIRDGASTEVAIKVFKDPHTPRGRERTPEDWQALLRYAQGEVNALRTLAGIEVTLPDGRRVPLGPRVEGFVEVEGNFAIAMERIQGRAIDEMSAIEIRRFVTDDTMGQLRAMWDGLVQAGYEIGDFQFAVLTRDQVVNGVQRRAGDVVFWDAGALSTTASRRALGPEYSPLTGRYHSNQAERLVDMTLLEEHLWTVEDNAMVPRRPEDIQALDTALRGLLQLREGEAPTTQDLVRRFLDMGTSLSRGGTVEGLTRAQRIERLSDYIDTMPDRTAAARLESVLRRIGREAGVQLLRPEVAVEARRAVGAPELAPSRRETARGIPEEAPTAPREQRPTREMPPREAAPTEVTGPPAEARPAPSARRPAESPAPEPIATADILSERAASEPPPIPREARAAAPERAPVAGAEVAGGYLRDPSRLAEFLDRYNRAVGDSPEARGTRAELEAFAEPVQRLIREYQSEYGRTDSAFRQSVTERYSYRIGRAVERVRLRGIYEQFRQGARIENLPDRLAMEHIAAGMPREGALSEYQSRRLFREAVELRFAAERLGTNDVNTARRIARLVRSRERPRTRQEAADLGYRELGDAAAAYDAVTELARARAMDQGRTLINESDYLYAAMMLRNFDLQLTQAVVRDMLPGGRGGMENAGVIATHDAGPNDALGSHVSVHLRQGPLDIRVDVFRDRVAVRAAAPNGMIGESGWPTASSHTAMLAYVQSRYGNHLRRAFRSTMELIPREAGAGSAAWTRVAQEAARARVDLEMSLPPSARREPMDANGIFRVFRTGDDGNRTLAADSFLALSEADQTAMLTRLRNEASRRLEAAEYMDRGPERTALEAQGHYWEEAGVYLTELRSLRGGMAQELARLRSGVSAEQLIMVYRRAGTLAEARQAVMDTLGIELGAQPPRSPMYERFVTLAHDHYLFGMVSTGRLLNEATALVHREMPGARLSRIQFRNGLVGAYELTFTRTRTMPDGTTRTETRTLYAKRQDLRADYTGSEAARRIGAFAPDVAVEGADGRPFMYNSPDGERIRYGILGDINDFRGTLRIAGRDIRVAVEGAESIFDIFNEYGSPEALRRRQALREELTRDPEAFMEAIGYYQTGSAAAGFFDRHELNAWYGRLRIEAPPEITGEAARAMYVEEAVGHLRGQGYRVQQAPDGSYQFFHTGGIDSDTFGTYLLRRESDGSFSFQEPAGSRSELMAERFTIDLHRLFVTLTRHMNAAEAVRARAEGRAPVFRTAQELLNSAFADDGAFMRGARRWASEFRGDRAFAEGMRDMFTAFDREGAGAGLGQSPQRWQIEQLRRDGYSEIHGWFFNGDSARMHFRDGRSRLRADYEVSVQTSVAETARGALARLPEGETSAILRVDDLPATLRRQVESAMTAAGAPSLRIRRRRYFTAESLDAIPDIRLLRIDDLPRSVRSDLMAQLRAAGVSPQSTRMEGGRYLIFSGAESIPERAGGFSMRSRSTSLRDRAMGILRQGDYVYSTDMHAMRQAFPQGRAVFAVRLRPGESARARGARELRLGVAGDERFLIFDRAEDVPARFRERYVEVTRYGDRLNDGTGMAERLYINSVRVGAIPSFEHMLSMDDSSWGMLWNSVRSRMADAEGRAHAEAFEPRASDVPGAAEARRARFIYDRMPQAGPDQLPAEYGGRTPRRSAGPAPIPRTRPPGEQAPSEARTGVREPSRRGEPPGSPTERRIPPSEAVRRPSEAEGPPTERRIPPSEAVRAPPESAERLETADILSERPIEAPRVSRRATRVDDQRPSARETYAPEPAERATAPVGARVAESELGEVPGLLRLVNDLRSGRAVIRNHALEQLRGLPEPVQREVNGLIAELTRSGGFGRRASSGRAEIAGPFARRIADYYRGRGAPTEAPRARPETVVGPFPETPAARTRALRTVREALDRLSQAREGVIFNFRMGSGPTGRLVSVEVLKAGKVFGITVRQNDGTTRRYVYSPERFRQQEFGIRMYQLVGEGERAPRYIPLPEEGVVAPERIPAGDGPALQERVGDIPIARALERGSPTDRIQLLRLLARQGMIDHALGIPDSHGMNYMVSREGTSWRIWRIDMENSGRGWGRPGTAALNYHRKFMANLQRGLESSSLRPAELRAFMRGIQDGLDAIARWDTAAVLRLADEYIGTRLKLSGSRFDANMRQLLEERLTRLRSDPDSARQEMLSTMGYAVEAVTARAVEHGVPAHQNRYAREWFRLLGEEIPNAGLDSIITLRERAREITSHMGDQVPENIRQIEALMTDRMLTLMQEGVSEADMRSLLTWRNAISEMSGLSGAQARRASAVSDAIERQAITGLRGSLGEDATIVGLQDARRRLRSLSRHLSGERAREAAALDGEIVQGILGRVAQEAPNIRGLPAVEAMRTMVRELSVGLEGSALAAARRTETLVVDEILRRSADLAQRTARPKELNQMRRALEAMAETLSGDRAERCRTLLATVNDRLLEVTITNERASVERGRALSASSLDEYLQRASDSALRSSLESVTRDLEGASGTLRDYLDGVATRIRGEQARRSTSTR